MRHGKKLNHLGRQKGHRRALMANLSSALIKHKRIETTLAKAKALRQYLEPLITKAKNNTTHSRRIIFGYLQDKNSIKELFESIAAKVSERPGGYLRIIRVGTRIGDSAELALIEFVDYNETYVVDKKRKATTIAVSGKKTRRGKSGKAKTNTEEQKPTAVSENEGVSEEKGTVDDTTV